MFGYGSLINMDENNELNDHLNKKVYPVKIKHLIREWNINGSLPLADEFNQTFLGVKENSESWCNGILFFVSEEELKLLDQRERYYVKKYIEKSDIEFYELKENILELDRIDKIIYYHTDSKYEGKPSELYPVSARYINICLEGCEKISDKFKEDFIMTTIGWDDVTKYRYEKKYL